MPSGDRTPGEARRCSERCRPVEVHSLARGCCQGQVRDMQAAAPARRRSAEEEPGWKHSSRSCQRRRLWHTGGRPSSVRANLIQAVSHSSASDCRPPCETRNHVFKAVLFHPNFSPRCFEPTHLVRFCVNKAYTIETVHHGNKPFLPLLWNTPSQQLAWDRCTVCICRETCTVKLAENQKMGPTGCSILTDVHRHARSTPPGTWCELVNSNISLLQHPQKNVQDVKDCSKSVQPNGLAGAAQKDR